MRPLRQVLSGETTLAGLLDRRSRELVIERCVRATLPPTLAACATVVDARSPELLLAATSGAAAALLRQRAPEIMQRLTGEGHEFTGIRIRVQARAAVGKSRKSIAKQLDAQAAKVLQAAARELAGSPVAKALERLARRAAVAPGAAALQGDKGPPERVEDEDREQ